MWLSQLLEAAAAGHAGTLTSITEDRAGRLRLCAQSLRKRLSNRVLGSGPDRSQCTNATEIRSDEGNTGLRRNRRLLNDAITTGGSIQPVSDKSQQKIPAASRDEAPPPPSPLTSPPLVS